MSQETERIRQLNDEFRRHIPNVGGTVVVTSGVDAEGGLFTIHALNAVRQFENFTTDNDPHGEHDFGSFEIEGQRLFWKIDYYDKSMEAGSEDPSDPDQTTRVMTVMLAEEY